MINAADVERLCLAALERPASELNYVVVPFDQIFQAVRTGQAAERLHEGLGPHEAVADDGDLGRAHAPLPCRAAARSDQSRRMSLWTSA